MQCVRRQLLRRGWNCCNELQSIGVDHLWSGSCTERAFSFSPVESVIQVIDGFNDLTPFPWWSTLSLTAIGLRFCLFPLTVKQIQSSSSNFSLLRQAWQITKSQSSTGKIDYGVVLHKFRKLRKYSGSPHPSWIVLAPLIQIPSFLMVVVSVRRMCTQGWPGLENGGALWFADLTQTTLNFGSLETHMGPIGAVLPLAITLTYLLNLELTFQTGRMGANVSGSIGETVGKLLRFGMEWLAVPTLIITLQLPQGTLIYWLTSSCCSIGQNLILGNSSIRQKLKLPQPGDGSADIMSKFHPEVMDLFLKAAEFRAKENHQEALVVLTKITDLDNENPRAHYAKGQLHGELKQWTEAIESYQSAFQFEPDQRMKAKSLLGIGIAQFMQGEISISENTLLSALELDNKDLAILMALCSLYKNTKQLERAKEIVNYAVEIDSRCKQWEEHL